MFCSSVGVGKLTAGGKQQEVMQAETDKVWLSSLEGVRLGPLAASTCEILREFQRVWSARWIKRDDLLPSQWMQIVAFAKRTLALPCGNFSFGLLTWFLLRLHAKNLRRQCGRGLP